MNRVLCQIGVLVMIYSLLAWIDFSSDDAFGVTEGELASAFALGFMLMLPELAYQLQQLFSSKPKFDDEWMN
ncbi:MAG TPA: hypothetical protein VM571_14430 [Noviherbaspirillum sp.]|nr:hypothetical protein [Noviherbaspirillum sp.]